MNETRDSNQSAPTGDSGELDPRDAAILLEKTTLEARRQMQPFPPWLTATRGFGALAICIAVWFSVRSQDPYKGPTAAVLPVVAVFVVLNLGLTLFVAKRATAGIRGRSQLRPVEMVAMALAWIVPFLVLALLAGYGVSDSIVFGVFLTTVPFISAGLAWAGVMALRANWLACGTGVAVAVVGVIALFAGPVGTWLVLGIGLFIVLVGKAVIVARQQRA